MWRSRVALVGVGDNRNASDRGADTECHSQCSDSADVGDAPCGRWWHLTSLDSFSKLMTPVGIFAGADLRRRLVRMTR